MPTDADSDTRAEVALGWATLFASTGTLVCCALPIILVTLGLGATVAALTNAVPLLIKISQYKTWVFAGAGLLLVLSAWVMYRPNRACPADPELARICAQTLKWNRRILWTSATVWGIGFFAAYLILPLRIWLDG